MDKIKIKHTPKFIYIIMIILAVMGIGVNYYFKIAEKTEKSDMIYGLIICILFFVVLFSVIFVKTTIKFGEGSIIKCKWLFLFWKIDLNKWLRALMMIHGLFYFSCTFMPMTGMFSKMSSGGDGLGVRLALVAWCVFFLPIGILSFLHFRKR